jgi:hypothetical protein
MYTSINGLAVGNNGTILRTEDGGETWESQKLGITQNLYAVQFIDSLTGWIAGEGGLIIKTTNGGISFVEKSSTNFKHNLSSFHLYQNYPNPFNPATKITFTLPKTESTKLQVYNTLGQLVETLVEDKLQSGSHEVEFNASHLPSGVYFYRIQVSEYVETKKMLLIK